MPRMAHATKLGQQSSGYGSRRIRTLGRNPAPALKHGLPVKLLSRLNPLLNTDNHGASMEPSRSIPKSVDEYIEGFRPEVQAILQRVRQVARDVAPQAQEIISYRMPALKQHGILIYFAAFKGHIGLYPPIAGDARLQKAIAPYVGEKGNLRFSYDKPIPYELIGRITKLRVKQDSAKAATKRAKARQ